MKENGIRFKNKNYPSHTPAVLQIFSRTMGRSKRRPERAQKWSDQGNRNRQRQTGRTHRKLTDEIHAGMRKTTTGKRNDDKRMEYRQEQDRRTGEQEHTEKLWAPRERVEIKQGIFRGKKQKLN